MTDTNAERLVRLGKINRNVRNNGAQTTSLQVDDIDWLIEQAEQANEIENRSLLNSLKVCDEENFLLRKAITQALEKHKWNNEESGQILEKVLEVVSYD